MRRRWFFLIVFIFLYIVPVNLSSYSSPSTIPAEQTILSADTSYYVEHGRLSYLGAGVYSYSTSLGERNTWDGDSWEPYIVSGNSVYFAGMTLNVYDWYTTLDQDSLEIVDDMRWEVQQNVNDKWRVLDLWEQSVLSPVQTQEKVSIGNSMTDGFSFANVTYHITNCDMMKVRVDFIPYETGEYRFIWSMAGIQGDVQEANESIAFDEVQIGFNDLIESNMSYVYDWTVADKKLDVVIGPVVLEASEHFVIDPSVNPVIGADGNDDFWMWITGEWTHATTGTEVFTYWVEGTHWYIGQFRFQLAIPQGATIDSATFTGYETQDSTVRTGNISRIDETNVGVLEDDVTVPIWDWSDHKDYAWDASGAEWGSPTDIADIVQTQVDLIDWESNFYIGLVHSINGTGTHRFEDYSDATTNHAYLNITYSTGAENTVPVNDACELTNPDDTDNLYANYKEYIFTSNVTDGDGFADIDYIEMSAYSGSAYWTVRYDEDTDTFSEELGSSCIVLGGSSAAVEDGDTINITWYITIEWEHSDLTNYDLRLYTVDDEPESDTDDYDLNYDYITEVDITTGPTLDDGSGTADRGDYDSIDSITATGTIDYYSSSISPASDEVDVWVSCADVAGGPWSDLTLTDGAFSLTVDSDDIVGLDTYTFKVVEEGAGAGGSDLLHSSETDTYIADRMVITILADDDTVINGTQVNFTVSVIYDYDDTSFSWWNISVTNDGVFFGVFNYSSTNFNDTDADTTNVYSVNAFNNETTHIITKFSVVTESVTWSAEGVPTTTTTDTGFFYQIFLSLEMWSIFGPALIVICGFVVAKKDRGLGIIFFIVECLVVYQYFMLVDATPFYWWHIIILMFGGIIPCGFSLSDR